MDLDWIWVCGIQENIQSRKFRLAGAFHLTISDLEVVISEFRDHTGTIKSDFRGKLDICGAVTP
ncbi:Hypothetical protein SMAX5B_005654 [Scophthalmus maximus]|uniref:Uncharacterized protein n=1 Tax=Scophthalmus maximus TaxID=52904 RepID=A0A2U9BBF2_SCOMX|nr:Hypothetical protein SMAX5B_005654 [Scophthalmus maximus]